MRCDGPTRHLAADDRDVLVQAILEEHRDPGPLLELLARDDEDGVTAAVFYSDVFIALWRLLDDFGWCSQDARELVALTLPDRYLSLALTWIGFANRSRAADHGSLPIDRRTQALCGELLQLLPTNVPALRQLDSRQLWDAPTPPPTLDRAERDLLRHAIVADLGRLPAIAEAIERFDGDPRPAQLLRRRYEADFSLLHDLGFAPNTTEPTFILRTHPQAMEVALRHLAVVTLETALLITRDEHGRDRATATQLKRCGALCDRLLRELPTTDRRGRQ